MLKGQHIFILPDWLGYKIPTIAKQAKTSYGARKPVFGDLRPVFVRPLAVSENANNSWTTWHVLITFCIQMHVNII